MQKTSKIAVVFDKSLAEQLNLPVVAIDNTDYQFLLVATDARLELRETKKNIGPLYVDFLHGAAAHRKKYGGGRGQLISKAVGIKKDFKPKVLDATAGLGRDAYVLASLGCEVTLLERSPIIAALLEDGLERAQNDPAVSNMNFIATDAIFYMQQTKIKYDVIYLDPMFPARTKSALVKKEMRILNAIVGEDMNAEQLLQAALQVADKRVVVKRPKLASSIPGVEPTLQYKGKSSRFDVYLSG